MTSTAVMNMNTGEVQYVKSHTVIGAITSGVVAGAINYGLVKKDKMDKDEAIKSTAKIALQGGIAAGGLIAAANYLARGNIFGMLTAASIGAVGVYGIEKICEKTNKKEEIITISEEA